MLEFLRNLNPNNRTTATNRRNDAPTVPTVTIEVSPPAEEEDRAQWKSPVQFFMTILGFCVGLGNIWRFPYLCQKNGGGKFVLILFPGIRWHFPLIFVLLKLTCLVTLFDSKVQLFKNFKNEPFLAFLMNFCPLVNVARFARDIE